MLNETKLDDSVPQSFFVNNKYKMVRRDRTGRGGGILILLRNEYTLVSCVSDPIYELLTLQVTVDHQNCNFVCCYKSLSINTDKFINYLDSHLLSIDLSKPLFIIGDLNFDLLTDSGRPLQGLMENYDLNNAVQKPTRIAHRIKNRENKKLLKSHGTAHTKTYSSTLLDVILHNGDTIAYSDVIGCPFSDHKFVVASLMFPSLKHKVPVFTSRCLTEANLKKIEDLLLTSGDCFKDIDELIGPDSKLNCFQSTLIDIINKICPEKRVKRKSSNVKPSWKDHELIVAKNEREYL